MYINILFIETFHINPQLHLILSEMEEVIVSLNQHSIMEPKVRSLYLRKSVNALSDELIKLSPF